MNLLFLTLNNFESLSERTIYTDLLREFTKNGHHVYAISPVEKRYGIRTHVVKEERTSILRLQIGNIQKTSFLKKGISTILIEPTFKLAIKRYFSSVRFDLVLYSTPPITFLSAVKYVKKRDSSKTYLLLKDIFPQNAVDLQIVSIRGIKGIIYRYFRTQEKKLYRISDIIGCMSQANLEYVIKHNQYLSPQKIEVNPNCIDIVDLSINYKERDKIRCKYELPIDKTVFVYGGNLGKPQGIPFIIECMSRCSNIDEAYFLIIGDGTEFGAIEDYVNLSGQSNLKLLRQLPKDDYDLVVSACDVGMIFLDHRFTIPNFPSRLLGYMQAKIPVLAVTDPYTDIGKTIIEGRFGWWCESDKSEEFYKIVKKILVEIEKSDYGETAFSYLKQHFSSQQNYKTIMRHF